MKKTLLMASAAIGLGVSAAVAQGPSAIRLRLEPGSEITIQGTSTLHDFHCRTDKILAYVDVDPSYTKDLTKVAKPLVRVQVNIVARTLTCGGGTIDNNMYKTLKTDQFQMIKYTMSGYDLLDATTSSFSANTKGTLQIAGQDKAVDIKINAARLAEGKASAEGEEMIKLTDFGIDPPSFMFGRLKVGNELKVRFNLKAGPELIAQLKTAINGE
jgi:YceI-like domain